ncbi:tRNAHis guanylyltransferase-domain-containing protein [Cladochytrium replicatum]|nr:tRNAHis guanylyltransferase-domain-containing protein [Cladochytrium replicatum]
MAKSKWEYVKNFELDDTLLPSTYIVIRIDGHGFHRFSKEHSFAKPNDDRGLKLMNAAAVAVMNEFKDIVIAYGESDEYSFVFRRACQLYKRRSAKICSLVVSSFTASYCMKWTDFFVEVPMKYAPTFDGRAVMYPTDQILKDYLNWRQADCHINNLYNTAFWSLVYDPSNPRTEAEAQRILKDTDSAAKNELLFTQYGINYNSLPALYRKGSVLYRKDEMKVEQGRNGEPVTRKRNIVCVDHVDIIGDAFWTLHANILGEI